MFHALRQRRAVARPVGDLHNPAQRKSGICRDIRIHHEHDPVRRKRLRHLMLEDIQVESLQNRLFPQLGVDLRDRDIPLVAELRAERKQHTADEVVRQRAAIFDSDRRLISAVDVILVVKGQRIRAGNVQKDAVKRIDPVIVGENDRRDVVPEYRLRDRVNDLIGLIARTIDGRGGQYDRIGRAVGIVDLAVKIETLVCPVTGDIHRDRVIVVHEHRARAKDRRVPFAFGGDVLQNDLVPRIRILCRGIEQHVGGRVQLQHLFRKPHRPFHVGFPVRTGQAGKERTDLALILYRRTFGKICRLVSGNDDRDIAVFCKNTVCRRTDAGDCSFKARFTAVLRIHAGRRIKDQDLFAIGRLRLIGDHGHGKDQCTCGKDQDLAQQDQQIAELADRHALFSVSQAEFPYKRTGNHLLLIVGLENVNDQERNQPQKPQQSKR